MERNTLFCFFFIYFNNILNDRRTPKWFCLFIFSRCNEKQLHQNPFSLATWIFVGNIKTVNVSCTARGCNAPAPSSAVMHDSLPQQQLLPLFNCFFSQKALPAWATAFQNPGATSWGWCLSVLNSASHPSRVPGENYAAVRSPTASSFESMSCNLARDHHWRSPPSDPCSLREGLALEHSVKNSIPWEGPHDAAGEESEDEGAAEIKHYRPTAASIPHPKQRSLEWKSDVEPGKKEGRAGGVVLCLPYHYPTLLI